MSVKVNKSVKSQEDIHNQFITLIGPEHKTNIDNLLAKVSNGKELELIFFYN